MYKIFLLFTLLFGAVFSEDLTVYDQDSVEPSVFFHENINSIVEFEGKGKIDILAHFKDISFIRAIAYGEFLKITDERQKKRLDSDITAIDQYQHTLIDTLVDSKNQYKNMIIVAENLDKISISPDSLDAYLYYPLIQGFSRGYKLFRHVRHNDSLEKITVLEQSVRSRMQLSYYDSLLKSMDVEDENLMTIVSCDCKSAKVVYFDRTSGRILTKNVFPGSIIGNIKIAGLSDDTMTIVNLDSNRMYEKKYNSSHWDSSGKLTGELKKSLRIVPWFGEDFAYTVKKGGKFFLMLKVIDEKGLTQKNITLNLDGFAFRSDSRGMITIPLNPALFPSNRNTFTVSLSSSVKADFMVDIKPRDMFVSYSASLGVNVGAGLEPVLAGASVGVKPACSGTLIFVANNVENKWEDKLMVTVFPTLTGSFSASLGPKLKPLDIKVLSHNLGAGAGATVGFNASTTFGFTQQYLFEKPYTDSRKAETVLMLDKLMTFSGPFKPLMSTVLKKASNVDIQSHQIYASLSVVGSAGVNGDIGGSLGLVKTDENGKITSTTAGVSATVVSGSASMNMGIEGGILNGFTAFGPTEDKYNVVLKSGLEGNFSALKFSGQIFGKKLIPEWFLTDATGNLGANLIFRFDKNKSLTKSIIVFNVGYKFKNNPYNVAIAKLKEFLKKSGASASDYAELKDVQGMTKIYIFVIDRAKTEKYFSEWVAFSRVLLTQNSSQNQHTVSAKVKGLFGIIAQSFRKLAETPIPFIEKTDLLLTNMHPQISVAVSAGIKLNIGISTAFVKTKSYVDRAGYFSGFNVYESEVYGYTRDIAKSDRSLMFLIQQVSSYVYEEVSDSASYVVKKAKDGTLYIAQKMKDGTVYMIKVAVDGTVTIVHKVGKAAKEAWNATLDAVGTAAEFYYEAGSNFVDGMKDALDTIWGWF